MISLIAAISENRALGKDYKLLWYIPEDLRRFKELTIGHPVIMGRKTFESIGKPLPQRENIVVSRDVFYKPDGVIVYNSFLEAIEEKQKSKKKDELFVIGGGQIFEQAIDLANKLYLTIVEGVFEADTFFPDYSAFKKVVAKKRRESNGYKYTFLDLMK